MARDDEEIRLAQEFGNNVFGEAMGEVLLLGITAHVGKGENCDRRFIGEFQGWFDRRVTCALLESSSTRYARTGFSIKTRISGYVGIQDGDEFSRQMLFHAEEPFLELGRTRDSIG